MVSTKQELVAIANEVVEVYFFIKLFPRCLWRFVRLPSMAFNQDFGPWMTPHITTHSTFPTERWKVWATRRGTVCMPLCMACMKTWPARSNCSPQAVRLTPLRARTCLNLPPCTSVSWQTSWLPSHTEQKVARGLQNHQESLWHPTVWIYIYIYV